MLVLPFLEDASSGLEVKEGSRSSPSLQGTSGLPEERSEERRDLSWLGSGSQGARPRPSQGLAPEKGISCSGREEPH